MEFPLDYADLLRAFGEAEVRYLVVGGYALAFHGHPRFTKDIDLWIDPIETNVDAAVRALAVWGAPTAVGRDLVSAAALDVVWIGNPPVRVDLMKHVPAGDFDSAWKRRRTGRWGDLRVEFVGYEDLVLLKRASGRPQDLIDLEALAGSD